MNEPVSESWELIKQRVLDASRAEGCDCNPNVTYTLTDKKGPDFDQSMMINVEHDYNCAVMRRD